MVILVPYDVEPLLSKIYTSFQYSVAYTLQVHPPERYLERRNLEKPPHTTLEAPHTAHCPNATAGEPPLHTYCPIRREALLPDLHQHRLSSELMVDRSDSSIETHGAAMFYTNTRIPTHLYGCRRINTVPTHRSAFAVLCVPVPTRS